jgi:hypothetical protein
MTVHEVEKLGQSPGPFRPSVWLSRYAEVALDSAVKRIIEAPAGQQALCLNREAFCIGRLAGAGEISPALALEALRWAASNMPSYEPRRPWRPTEVCRKATDAFCDGLRRPRKPRHG